jgi:hypothetical protein
MSPYIIAALAWLCIAALAVALCITAKRGDRR